MDIRSFMLLSAVAGCLIGIALMQGCTEDSPTTTVTEEEKIRYRGCCLFPHDSREKMQAAVNEYGMNVIRYLCGDNEKEKGFLVGNPDNYEGIVQKDLTRMDSILSWTTAENVTMILEMHHLPGRYWNAGKSDNFKLFTDFEYHKQAAQFWKDMATHYKGKEIIFELLNEPNYWDNYILNEFGYENVYVDDASSFTPSTVEQIYSGLKGTAGDINLLYKTLVAAVREVDSSRIVMLQPEYWADPACIDILEPIYKANGELDPNVRYAFHYYKPGCFTHQNEEYFSGSYPGLIEGKWEKGVWNKETIRESFERVESWRKKHSIPASWIYCTEFNSTRWAKGAELWLEDVVSLLEEYGYHWTYYAFREDEWTNMDAELGSEEFNRVRSNDTPHMKALSKRFDLN